MQQSDTGRDSNGLGPDVLRGISLQELDKRAQGHQDLVSVYLGWLQEHLNDWDLSDSAAFRPQVESWYASLRFHGHDDQHIRDAFATWMSSQIQDDASCARRLLVAQQELLSISGGIQTTQPRDLGMDQGTAGVITVKEDKIIDISSGDGDSDVEFLGWKHPDSMRRASKSVRRVFPPLTGANKETQRMQGAECLEPNERSKGSKARKVTHSRIPSGTPPKGYVCGRCGEKGHFKEQCPTNLDPSLDPRPTGGYQCYCCGAKEKHLTTLCPFNENPNSLTQQRIKAGVTLSDLSLPPRGTDHYRPPHNQPRKAKKTTARPMNSAAISGKRGGLGNFDDDDDDHRMDPARRARLERSDRERSSPLSDDRMTGLERSHYSPSREKHGGTSSIEEPRRTKRGRTSSIEEPRRTKRARRWRNRRRSGSQSSQSEREESAELLPRVGHHSSGDGRLSYWDDGYNDVKMSSTISSEETRRSGPAVHQLSDSLAAEMQRLYPDADADWVCDMASFDVDDFFRELEDYRPPAGTFQIEEDTRTELSLFDDEECQAVPRVRLPRAEETFLGTTSDRNALLYKHQSRANDAEDRSDGQEGDNDSTSHVRNSKIVVKLPQGTRAALSMDNFSSQLKVNSPPLDGLSE